ncbi:MAG: 6-bladed beta-propeller [Algoriphagus sp.]|jgi:uncharacterized protein YwgA|nr:6-bladed beta-propeller [Algoriphagus sp.]
MDLFPLETNAQNLMGNDLRVRKSKNKIYVMDIAQRDGIHVFSASGQFLKTVAVKGEGPNELKGLQDFQIDAEDRLFVLATLGDRTTIYQISDEGELQKLTDTEYLASAFTHAEKDEFYLYGSYNKPLVTHRLVRVDSSGKVLQSYFPNDYTNEMLPMTERNFYETESGDLVLAEIFNDTLYSIQSGEVKPMLNLDLGRFQIPKEFWEMDLMEGYQMIQEQGFAVYKSAFSNSKKIIANIHFQGNEIGTQKKVYLYDRQGGEFQVLDYSEQEAEIWNDPVGLEKDHVWFLTYHSFLKKSENSTLSPELRAKITEQDFDYPILIKAKIN